MAQDGGEDAGQGAEQFVAGLQFKEGGITVPKAHARFQLTPDFRYLEQADARRVLEDLWGNPPDESVLGLIVPRKPDLLADDSWAVVVTYSDEGYVSDEDAAKIDYAEMLTEMKKSTSEENSARKEAGYGTVDLVGWAVPPRYDGSAKKLYWAKELSFDGNAQHTLNYDIRVLGRHGYLSLNAVAGMSELAQVQKGMQELLPMTEFDAGARYADFDASTDKVASYGLAALVGGGLAAKAGLFAKIGLVLAKFWKLLLIGVVAVGAGIRRVFAGKKEKPTVS
ncbi:DUF2167 domain-containing protein [Pseudoxanthomonas sp. z9]|uniref:DUF2167 domain-containing protein n=1 Tax=Pseudoxanthomonas sp. z9 TaxID=2584942 RepID=UPI0021059358|nr:DUF2167 domain-containing protein [Pseudoxanthomonas sp. z9]